MRTTGGAWMLLMALSLTMTSTAMPAENAVAQRRGLYVQNKVLMRAGRPYHGIGANYFSLFYRMVKNGSDSSGLDNLKKLSQAGVPFVRFMCGGYWPSDQKLYLENKDEYFRRLDRVVKTAEANGIGLIPSLFWHLPTVPDVVGEPLEQLANPDSKSIAFIRRYTEEVVTRYRNSPAIWGWEFGNEANLAADLPNAAAHRPPVQPELGTPATRSERDELKWPALRAALVAFATTVRRLDKERFITSGHAVPRASAWHNTAEKTWTEDTEAQFGEVLRRDNPDPLDVVSIHLYPGENGRYSGGATSIEGAIEVSQKWARLAGKPLFLGEFGAERKMGAAGSRQAFQEFLKAIEKHRVPLAAFWVFDLEQQNADWNINFANDRAEFIQMVAAANARLSGVVKAK